MFQFDFIDPDARGSDLTARSAAANAREEIGGLGSHTWGEHLTACWGEIAAGTKALLRRSNEHEVLAYVGTVLRAVDHRLVELIREPEVSSSRGPRGGIWCAAQALDASVMAWQRLRPSDGRRPRAFGSRLEQRIAESPLPALSTASVAATSRIASAALEQLARSLGPPETALRALEEAAVELAATGIAVWADARLRRPEGSLVDRTVTMHRLAADVGAAAAIEERACRSVSDSAADWLAVAIAREAPTISLALIDDPRADRVLRAEALSISSTAWIRRGALELLALQRLDHESNIVPLRCLRSPAHAAAAVRAAQLTVPMTAAGAATAWRRHSLALAQPVATYLRECTDRNTWFGDTREVLIGLLADSLAQAAKLDARFRNDGGSRARRA
jgi:hypothetical protein